MLFARYAHLPFFFLDVILPAKGRLRPDRVGDHVDSANGSCVGQAMIASRKVVVVLPACLPAMRAGRSSKP
jgi:hypothetical protein